MMNYNEMVKGCELAEKRGAEKRGMTVEEFRAYQARQNRIKTYEIKIQRYKEAIEKMEKYIKENA